MNISKTGESDSATRPVLIMTKNAIVQTGGVAVSRLTTLLYFAFLARVLNVSKFGKYSIALTIVGITNLIVDFGISYVITRNVARDRTKANQYLTTALAIKTAMAVLTFILLWLVVIALHYPPDTVTTIYLISISMLAEGFFTTFTSTVFAFERMEFDALALIVRSLLVAILGVAAIEIWNNLQAVSITYVIAWYLGSVFYFVIFYFKILKIHVSFDFQLAKSLLLEAWPFAITSVFVLLYFRIGGIVLSIIGTEQETGLYLAALKPIESALFIPAALAQALYPVFSRLHINNPFGLASIAHKVIRYISMVAIFLASGSLFWAPSIIMLLYGKDFLPGSNIFSVLLLALAVLFVSTIMNFQLYAVDRQDITAKTALIKTIISFSVSMVLIPFLGGLGAALALLMTELVNFGLSYYFISRLVVKINFPVALFKPLIAGLVSAGLAYLLRTKSFLISMPFCALFFLIILFISKAFDQEDISLMIGILVGLIKKIRLLLQRKFIKGTT